MAYKVLGTQVSNPVDESFNGATLVYVYATAETLLTRKKSLADGGADIGTMTIPANGTISLVKDPTDRVSCSNSFCSPIANHW